MLSDDKYFYKKGLCGLVNVGNTCFLNTILQCINANRDLFLILHSNDIKIDNTKKEYNLITQWKILSKLLWENNAVIKPTSFIQQLTILLKAEKDYLHIGNQEDSHEILQFILEKFHEGLSKKVNIQIEGEIKTELDKKTYDAFKIWKLYFENSFSPILNLYYGQFINIVKNEKEELSYQYDPFSTVSLEVCNFNDIYQCFDNFTKTEQVNNLKRKIMFWKLPEHLIIIFKRYNYNLSTKNSKKIDFPEDLNLSKYVIGNDKKKATFKLYAIANHSGNQIGGHYYASIKNLDEIWYRYNDHIVSLQDMDTLINGNAYCLFYQKIN